MELFNILITAVNAVIPIVLLIALGFLLRRRGFFTEEFIRVGNRLGFQVLMPCMLFINVYAIESFSAIPWDVVLYSLVMLLLLFVLGAATVGLTTREHKRRGVMLQSAVRSNVAIIGMSLTSALGGSEALAVTSVILAFSQPLLNTLAVIALTVYGDEGKKISVRDILKKIATNPLILGILAGLLALGIRTAQAELLGRVVFSIQRDVKFVYSAMNSLKSIASPFMLLILGAQFDFSASKGMMREIVTGTLTRVVVSPLLAIGVAVLLSARTDLIHFGVNEYPALIALFGSPTAVSSAIMAGQMGHDQQLATQLVVWTSLVSIATMFLTVCILMAGGMLAV